MTIFQLFGETNALTSEWHNGVLAQICIDEVDLQDDAEKWIVLDGPVDSFWLENLNTTLDDNRLLCLFNGQRIKLTKDFFFFFEIDSLGQISPASISRCGLIHYDPFLLSWEIFLSQWPRTFVPKIRRKF